MHMHFASVVVVVRVERVLQFPLDYHQTIWFVFGLCATILNIPLWVQGCFNSAAQLSSSVPSMVLISTKTNLIAQASSSSIALVPRIGIGGRRGGPGTKTRHHGGGVLSITKGI